MSHRLLYSIYIFVWFHCMRWHKFNILCIAAHKKRHKIISVLVLLPSSKQYSVGALCELLSANVPTNLRTMKCVHRRNVCIEWTNLMKYCYVNEQQQRTQRKKKYNQHRNSMRCWSLAAFTLHIYITTLNETDERPNKFSPFNLVLSSPSRSLRMSKNEERCHGNNKVGPAT